MATQFLAMSRGGYRSFDDWQRIPCHDGLTWGGRYAIDEEKLIGS